MGVKSTGSFPTTTKTDGHLVEYYRNSFGAGGGANAGPSSPSQLSASGGTTHTPGDGYKYHVFTSSATPGFDVSNAGLGEVEYLIVGGGGGGGRRTGGGGGAGGLRTGTSTGLTPGTAYPIVVGAGGAGGLYPAPQPYTGDMGGHSSFNSIRSEGGGGGKGFTGTPSPAYQFNGGSGGGGAYGTPKRPGGLGNREAGTDTPVPSQGNDGGTGGQPSGGMHPSWGGGGGGAGQVGGNGGSPITQGGNGGDGLAAFSGATGLPSDYGTPGPSAGRWFAGGGGGGGSQLPGTGGTGGYLWYVSPGLADPFDTTNFSGGDGGRATNIAGGSVTFGGGGGAGGHSSGGPAGTSTYAGNGGAFRANGGSPGGGAGHDADAGHTDGGNGSFRLYY